MDITSKIADAARMMGIDLTVDPDELHFEQASAVAACTRQAIFDQGALVLNLAMICDQAIDLEPMPVHFPSAHYLVETWRVSAADRYREIWGVAFEGVPALAGEDSAPRRSPRTAIGTGSESVTLVGSKR